MIKNGEGVFTYAGQVVNDSIEGTGCMIYTSGAVYQGQWKKGLQHCIGRFLYSDGVTEQEGVWIYGSFLRSGTWTTTEELEREEEKARIEAEEAEAENDE
jgi:hypothetical protein